MPINRDEAVFHSQMMKWLKHNLSKFPPSFLIETKVVRRGKRSFPYSELSPKEKRLLMRAKLGQVMHTHSDYGGMGTLCDGSVISGGGFVFLKWIEPGNKEFFVIEIMDLLNHEEKSDRKSLTKEEAHEIAYLVTKHI